MFDGVINSLYTTPGRGLPIGNFTSQFFAKHYMAVLDHLGLCRRYVHYMDDLVVCSESRSELRRMGQIRV